MLSLFVDYQVQTCVGALWSTLHLCSDPASTSTPNSLFPLDLSCLVGKKVTHVQLFSTVLLPPWKTHTPLLWQMLVGKVVLCGCPSACDSRPCLFLPSPMSQTSYCWHLHLFEGFLWCLKTTVPTYRGIERDRE